MCGIVGTVMLPGAPSKASSPPLEEVVGGMLTHIQPRGPDDQGLWHNGHTGLGHTRLSILDISTRGHQPFLTRDGQGVLVFNGEIYNFQEIRRALETEGIQFVSNTDTEVVLYALHHWGVEAAIPKFNGMFALAYADLRDNSLWLTRDRLGIKPLFIARGANAIAFASEQKALVNHPHIDARVDLQNTLSLFLYERFDDRQTPYETIQHFLPGRILRLKNGTCRWSTYYDLHRDLNVDSIRSSQRSLRCSTAIFEQALQDSVQAHMISDAPLATLCSGGLDSGLVTTMAARCQPQGERLVAYVADMVGMEGEERRRAQLITDHAGAELRPVEINQQTFLRALPQAIAANDQPLFFAQQVAEMLIAKQMRADGFKVVLTGDGADELFGGYIWHEEAYKKWRQFAWRHKWIPNHRLMQSIGYRVPGLAPVNLHREIENFALHHQPYDYVASPFNVALVAGVNRTLRQRDFFSQLVDLPVAERAFLANNFEDVYIHMRECLNTVDKMTMRYGVEARVPFLENNLMCLGFNLPVKHKYAAGQRKLLISRTAAKWLPKSVLNLPKIGFTAPATMWRNTTNFVVNGHVADLLRWPRAQRTSIESLLATKPYFTFRLLGAELWLRLTREGACPQTLGEQLWAAAE